MADELHSADEHPALGDQPLPVPEQEHEAALTPEKAADVPEQEHELEFKVAEVREDGTVIVELADGRLFPVALPEGHDRPRKGSRVELAYNGLDKEGVPVSPSLK